MVIFGLLLLQVENSAGFLTAFGFHQESYFVSLGLFMWLFMVSVDPILQVAINAQHRYYEYRADRFAARHGLGTSLQNALIRTYAENLDSVFNSSFDKWLNSSHPNLHERLESIETMLNEQPHLKQNAEENQQMLGNIQIEMTDSECEDEEAEEGANGASGGGTEKEGEAKDAGDDRNCKFIELAGSREEATREAIN